MRTAFAHVGWMVLTGAAMALHAAQVDTFGDVEIHSVVVNTTFLDPGIAERYGVTRRRDRAFVNVSVVRGGSAQRATVTGRVIDLVGHAQPLSFRELVDPTAVYYLAEVEHDDGETLRFVFEVRLADAPPRHIAFQETLYWEDDR